LKAIVGKIAANRDNDAWAYHADIESILEWFESVAEKESQHNAYGGSVPVLPRRLGVFLVAAVNRNPNLKSSDLGFSRLPGTFR
jgi:hypothetical protein